MTRQLIVPALFPPPDYAHASLVEAGQPLVFTAGAVPLDAEGNLIGVGDRTAQTGQVLANLDTALRAAGSSLAQVIASTVYVVADTPDQLSEVWEVVRRSPLAAGPHTSTLLGVSVLGYPGQLVEVTAVAARPSPGSAAM